MTYEEIMNKYGREIVLKAIDYFEGIHRHFTINEFITKCEELCSELKD